MRRGAKAMVALLALCTPAAEAGEFHGLLRSRDLTPFGFLRLDMRPAHAVTIEEGGWAIETEIGYQNTWALSPEVESYLTAREPLGRRDLGPLDFTAIRALPGENFLLDLESAAVDVTLHYKVSSQWTAYLIGSYVTYQGGFLDSTIESFHDTFGFSSFGRLSGNRNEVNLLYDLKSTQVSAFDSPVDGGFTDPTIGLRYSGLDLPGDRWELALEAAAKIPVAGERELLSTGRTDYGIQAALQRRAEHHALYVNAAAVYYAGGDFPVPQDEQIVPTLIVGYEHRLTERTNLNLQGYISTSVYSRQQTDLEELLSDKYQISVGVRHHISSFLVTFGVTENLQNLNNTPDIGFQLGFAWVPGRVGMTR